MHNVLLTLPIGHIPAVNLSPRLSVSLQGTYGDTDFFVKSNKKRPDIIESLLCEATSYSHRGKPPTTIGAIELNFRVRYGNGCDLYAIITSLMKDCSFKTG